MTVKVRFFKHFTLFTNGKEMVEVEGRSVGECLIELVRQFPECEHAIFKEKNVLLEYIDVFVNRENVYPDELSKSVNNGDEIYIAYALSGG